MKRCNLLVFVLALTVVACGDDVTKKRGGSSTNNTAANNTAINNTSNNTATNNTNNTSTNNTSTNNTSTNNTSTNNTSTNNTSTNNTSTNNTAGGCTKNGFPVRDLSLFISAGGVRGVDIVHEVTDTTLVLEIYGEESEVTGPGTYRIADTVAEKNYESCTTCVLIRDTCTQGQGCETYYFATEGFLDITTFGTNNMIGTFRELVLAEVTMGADFKTVPVPNGEVYCIDNLEFEVETVTD